MVRPSLTPARSAIASGLAMASSMAVSSRLILQSCFIAHDEPDIAEGSQIPLGGDGTIDQRHKVVAVADGHPNQNAEAKTHEHAATASDFVFSGEPDTDGANVLCGDAGFEDRGGYDVPAAAVVIVPTALASSALTETSTAASSAAVVIVAEPVTERRPGPGGSSASWALAVRPAEGEQPRPRCGEHDEEYCDP